jgi:hypothetical protein
MNFLELFHATHLNHVYGPTPKSHGTALNVDKQHWAGIFVIFCCAE